jgi:hypothetical protein
VPKKRGEDMVGKLYDITLKLKTPSDQGSVIDFTERQSEILEAVGVFNEKFRAWDKRIVIYMISKKSIHLLLAMEKEKGSENTSARDIRFFATYLNSVKNWHVFSRNSTNLFESVNFSHVDTETAKETVQLINAESPLYIAQREDIVFFQTLKTSAAKNQKDGEMTDEEATAVMNYLIITKNKGEKSLEKNASLTEIKKILKKWM